MASVNAVDHHSQGTVQQVYFMARKYCTRDNAVNAHPVMSCVVTSSALTCVINITFPIIRISHSSIAF